MPLRRKKGKTARSAAVTKAHKKGLRPEQRLLDTNAIARAEALGLHARKIVEGSMAGRYKSPFTGFAIEFNQHREYTAGDDLRHLDWKLFGRTDRYYIKQYEQETNFDASILLDGSKSMQYGSGATTKMEYGRLLAACLSYLILSERNSCTLGVFDTELRAFYPKTSTPRAINNICQTLVDFEPVAQSSIGKVLSDMAGQVKRRGIVIVISDFFDDPEAVLDGLRHFAFAKHDVVVFHVMDPYELEFPFDGTVEFEGLEVPDKLLLQPWNIRQSYLDEVTQFMDTLRIGCERSDISYNLVNTAEKPTEVLNRYLATRLRTTGR
ncbi:MAG: DUF58 domain-containing protein [Opitutales bacterium]